LQELRRSGTHFKFAECHGARTPCVPAYIRRWQQSIREALSRGTSNAWLTYPANAGTSRFRASGSRWTSCSVVGSAGSLLRQAHGRLIDAASAVFRVNAAPNARV